MQARNSIFRRIPPPHSFAFYVSLPQHLKLSCRGWLILPSSHHTRVPPTQPRTCPPPTPQALMLPVPSLPLDSSRSPVWPPSHTSPVSPGQSPPAPQSPPSHLLLGTCTLVPWPGNWLARDPCAAQGKGKHRHRHPVPQTRDCCHSTQEPGEPGEPGVPGAVSPGPISQSAFWLSS